MQNEKLFNWSHRRSWERVFHRLLADKINASVIAEVRQLNPRYLSDDNFAWLNSLVATVTKQSLEDIPALLAKRLSNHYKFIVTFHGTRSNSAANFLDHGLKLSDTKALEQRAIKIFGQTEELEKEIIKLRQSGYERHNHNKIYFCLTKRACLNESKDFLLEGSEYLAIIAHRLGQNTSITFGEKPLIVECRVPTSSLDSEFNFWRGRSFAMLEDYFTRLLHPSERVHVRSSCAITTKPISVENILRVHEFNEIKRTFREKNYFTGELQQSVQTVLQPFKIWPGKAKLSLSHISK